MKPPLPNGTWIETHYHHDEGQITGHQPLAQTSGWLYSINWATYDGRHRQPKQLQRCQFLLRDLPNPESAP